MNLIETTTPAAEDPTNEGWISLAPVHFFPWILLLVGFLEKLFYSLLPYEWHAWMVAGWGFTLLHWGVGGFAAAVAFQERSRTEPGSMRQAALILALILLGSRVCMGAASSFAFSIQSQTTWMITQGAFSLMGLSALILLLTGRGADAGGRFDAAVAALIFASGLHWFSLPILAIAAMRKHPLLSAQWAALREPKTALAGGWFDSLDEDARLRDLGMCSLALALAFLALVGGMVLDISRSSFHFGGFRFWWAAVDLAAANFASLLLGIHVIRRGRGRKGRGAAVVAILIDGLPLLLALVIAVFVALIITDVVHFRLF